jgi:predicted nucleic acid-binding protein
MSEAILLDTGPLVALLNRRDQHHTWATRQFETYALPFLSCEPVRAEAAHLLRRAGVEPATVLTLVTSGAVRLDDAMPPDAEALRAALARYRDVPMDVADACMVRLHARHPDSRILTLDSDFFVYRHAEGDTLPVPHPTTS